MKTSVMLLFGGASEEHEVSKMSAKNVYAAIDDSKYEVILVYIDKSGRWWLTHGIDGTHVGCPQLVPVLGQGQFITIPHDKLIKPDVLLPVVHGGDGEDGKIAHLGQMLHIPVVGCGPASSIVCWDKHLTKIILRAAGVAVSDHTYIKRKEKVSYQSLVETHGVPFFVKSTTSGSSIGVSKIHNEHEFHVALKESFLHSDGILVEPYLAGRELEVAVLGNYPDIEVSGVGEVIPGDEFYSFEDKYNTTSTARVIPHADVSDELHDQLQAMALDAFRACNCRGLARVDFLLDSAGQPYVSEINTFPGFTNISQYPKLWHESGIKYADLVDRLIGLALQK